MTALTLSVAQMLAIEADPASNTLPASDTWTVTDSDANLKKLTLSEIAAAPAIGVTAVAGSDAPPVFSAAQMKAFGEASIAVVAPASDSSQNDGTVTISGNGMTFVVTWDSSVASAPAAFMTDVEEVFQFYADTFSNPITLYYNVGFGERGGAPLGSSDLGTSSEKRITNQSYASLLTQLNADAASPAQKLALASLPATSPFGSLTLDMTIAQEAVLGFSGIGANPGGDVGFSDVDTWNYTSDPNQPPLFGEPDFFGTVEHEVSEVMGRVSDLGSVKGGTEMATTLYSPMDLFRYTAPSTRALSPFTAPAYFSIDNGVTPLGYWNNYTTGGTNDVGDWEQNADPPGSGYTPDAYNSGSNSDIDNPITSNDITLLNVLGYDLATATPPQSLPATDLPVTAGQLLADLSLNQINPGSTDVPRGDSYVLVDTAFGIESVTSTALTTAEALGLRGIIATDASLILSVAQGEALEGSVSVTVPSGDSVSLFDIASVIETMTPQQIAGLSSLGITTVRAADTSVVLDWAQVTVLSAANLQVTAPAGSNVIYADTAAAVAALTPAQRAELQAVGVTEIVSGPPSGTTFDMILQKGSTYEIYDIGNSALLAADQLGVVNTAFRVVDLGGFDGADTSDMLLRDTSNGTFGIDDVANNAITGSVTLGRVGSNWQIAGFGDFSGNAGETDMLLRNSNDGAFEVYDISNNAITFAAPMGQVGLEWQAADFADFSGNADETDMLMRNSNTGAFEVYDIVDNAITSATAMGQVGLEWQLAGFGDFSGRAGETDMLMRNSNTGAFEVYDISNNTITSASSMGQVGLAWQVAGFGDFSGNAGETDMLMRNSTTGAFEIYDISTNATKSATAMGQVGLEWQIVGFGDFSGNAGESDMLMRNSNSGAFELYDIGNNQITNAASMGQIGTEWSIAGIAADPPGAAPANAQMVQAMASVGTSAPVSAGNTAQIGAESSAQPLVTIPQHG
jgi:hypothetical protein